MRVLVADGLAVGGLAAVMVLTLDAPATEAAVREMQRATGITRVAAVRL
jgi:hypothetical protein